MAKHQVVGSCVLMNTSHLNVSILVNTKRDSPHFASEEQEHREIWGNNVTRKLSHKGVSEKAAN